MSVAVKICGLSTPEAVDAAVAGGARYVGFVFYPPSPRAVLPARAAELARRVPAGVRTVGLFVDPDDQTLERVLASVPLSMLQLHGGETPARVAEITAARRVPVMKAIRIAAAADVDEAAAYEDVADRLLFDARPPGARLPGGNGMPFDWTLLAGRRWRLPWMLGGGLTVENLAEAVAVTGADTVDVSSGVERSPGEKDLDLIRRFLEKAAALP